MHEKQILNFKLEFIHKESREEFFVNKKYAPRGSTLNKPPQDKDPPKNLAGKQQKMKTSIKETAFSKRVAVLIDTPWPNRRELVSVSKGQRGLTQMWLYKGYCMGQTFPSWYL